MTKLLTTGTRVRLNSGGPSMVVEEIAGDVLVSWRDASGEVNRARFPVACLTVIDGGSAI